jgi:hypothetical protein
MLDSARTIHRGEKPAIPLPDIEDSPTRNRIMGRGTAALVSAGLGAGIGGSLGSAAGTALGARYDDPFEEK